MNQTCFTSADPAAPTVTKLYDDNVDVGHFWDRDDPSTPLPPCSNRSYHHQCSICLDQLVKVFCHNLKAGVKFFMEGPGGAIMYNESDCAEPPPPMPPHPMEHLRLIISAIVCLILIFIIGAVLWRCRQKTNSSRTFRVAFSCGFQLIRNDNVGNEP